MKCLLSVDPYSFCENKYDVLAAQVPHIISNAVCSFFQDSSQIELLKELMDLQKDMVVMLLSMLEGSFELYLQVPFNLLF